jgi:cellulose synthase/poly-beta-1,6-N-acetylglucosamine synthase-like glycosyltransferase/spore germination protein YaaH/peptidoglycan/xylan/chitin deacetylase (PgdA/CDA1 family)
MPGPVFYDPERRRWKRLRRTADVLGVLATALVVFFLLTILRSAKLPQLLLPQRPRPYRALKEKEKKSPKRRVVARRSNTPPTEVRLNSDEGIRAAFYVNWDPASYSSLRENLRAIDLLFPDWLHVLTPDGRLQATDETGVHYDAIQNAAAVHVDDNEKVLRLLRTEQAETEILPMVNNFDGIEWVDITATLNNPEARANLRRQLLTFLESDRYRGLTLDLEAFPRAAQPGYRALLAELEEDLHSRGLKLYVAVPARNEDYDYKNVAAHADSVILMDYDEHFPGGPPGPVASQDWFTRNLALALKDIPADKLICAIANYGYDWRVEVRKHGRKRQLVPVSTEPVSVQDAWVKADESEADVDFDGDALNPHVAYTDGPTVRHEVWFTDAITAVNHMRAAQHLGINTFALWRLGSEDRSLWSVWDTPQDPAAAEKLRTVPPSYDVSLEGQGDIIAITARPSPGERKVTTDPNTGLFSDEDFSKLPIPYKLTEYGGTTKQIALTFDDGPDPKWTPQILDVLKAKQVKALFFLIGIQAEKYSSVTQRIFDEGHEIGNHTWTHPDISNIRPYYFRWELNLTERFFAGRLGVKPLMFRPPYSIDQEPDTADEVRPLEIAQDMGYITIGDKLDPNDWRAHPHRSAEQIASAILDGPLPPCKPENQKCGSIVLLHDGGGDRRETVRALPLIIDGLRARGYEIVPVSRLLGKTYADVMPPISANERWAARLDNLGFWTHALINTVVVLIFFVGDTLMGARLLLVGAAATFDRFRPRKIDLAAVASYQPAVAILIPAYNEEKVIIKTVRAALHSDYPRLRVIVIDDGSTDKTLAIARQAFAGEISAGRVLVLTKPNSGKANALNFGLAQVTEEIFLGIDADTVIHPRAVSLLVPHFLTPKVAAVAGNAKVGNRVNLWTRWQALEYVTSQNFERRALNCLGAVSVVPGAIGAWRTALVREAGAYRQDTVAEDADLTMELLRRGYRVQYEDRALAFTEAPSSPRGLMRQRFRWSFGILQSVWKHRHVVGRRGVLGWVALPNIVIFQILLPLVSPFIDLMFIFGVVDYLINKHFHPETADPASLQKLVAFFAAFLIIDFLASAVAFALERSGTDRREDPWLLGHVWLQRFAYRQLFSIVILKTLKRAVDGRAFAWDKLERTATVQVAHLEEKSLTPQ